MSDRYREYGQLIDARASKEVKVIVSGDSFAHLRCSLLLDNARRIDSHQFVTMATQLENEARAVLAKKLKVKTSGSFYELSSSLWWNWFTCCTSPLQLWAITFNARWIISPFPALDVANVLVWGNINGSFYVDLQRAKVFNYDGAVKGPAFY